MNEEPKVLRIGIATLEESRARALAVARGEHVPGPDEPKVWFTSLESLAQVLSTKNQLLLELIRRMKPASIAELAKISGREESNLNRTLHTMERYKLVRLTKVDRGRIVPDVPYDSFNVSVPIGAQGSKPQEARAH